MRAQKTRFSAAKSIFFGGLAISSLAIIFLGVNLGRQAKTISETKPVYVALDDFSWLGNATYALERAPEPVNTTGIKTQRTSRVIKKRLVTGRRVLTRVAKTDAAAPKIDAPVTQVADQQTLTANQKPAQSDREKLRTIHSMLRRQFFAAVNSQPTTILVAAVKVDTRPQPLPVSNNTKILAPKTTRKSLLVVKKAQHIVKVKPAKPVIAVIPSVTLAKLAPTQQSLEATKWISNTKAVNTQRGVDIQRAPKVVDRAPAVLPPDRLAASQAAANADESRPRSTQGPSLYSLVKAPDVRSITTDRGSIIITKAADKDDSRRGDGANQHKGKKDSLTDDKTDRTDTRKPYYDAFYPSDGFDADSVETLSYEGTRESQGGRWILIRKDGYVDLLTWMNIGNRLQAQPLVSHNSVEILARTLERKVRPGMGLVYGYVKAGWYVQLSQRSEEVAYFDKSLHRVDPADLDTDRFYIYLNVVPGSAVVQALEKKGKRGAGVGITVHSSTATHVDFRRFQAINISGRLVDAATPQGQSLDGVGRRTLRVVGQERATTMSDSDGFFEIRNVLAFGSYPLFVDAVASRGFVHRYRYLPQANAELFAFMFSNEQVSEWLGQLAGGVSSQSGLIIGSVPNLMKRYKDVPLFPAATSLLEHPSLESETYSLSLEGVLQIRSALEPSLPRLLVAEVSEGPALVELQDAPHNTVWSEVVHSQPGVINVIGP